MRTSTPRSREIFSVPSGSTRDYRAAPTTSQTPSASQLSAISKLCTPPVQTTGVPNPPRSVADYARGRGVAPEQSARVRNELRHTFVAALPCIGIGSRSALYRDRQPHDGRAGRVLELSAKRSRNEIHPCGREGDAQGGRFLEPLPPSMHSSARKRQPTKKSCPTEARTASNASRGRRSRFSSAPP